MTKVSKMSMMEYYFLYIFFFLVFRLMILLCFYKK